MNLNLYYVTALDENGNKFVLCDEIGEYDSGHSLIWRKVTAQIADCDFAFLREQEVTVLQDYLDGKTPTSCKVRSLYNSGPAGVKLFFKSYKWFEIKPVTLEF